MIRKKLTPTLAYVYPSSKISDSEQLHWILLGFLKPSLSMIGTLDKSLSHWLNRYLVERTVHRTKEYHILCRVSSVLDLEKWKFDPGQIIPITCLGIDIIPIAEIVVEKWILKKCHSVRRDCICLRRSVRIFCKRRGCRFKLPEESAPGTFRLNTRIRILIFIRYSD